MRFGLVKEYAKRDMISGTWTRLVCWQSLPDHGFRSNDGNVSKELQLHLFGKREKSLWSVPTELCSIKDIKM